MSQEQTYVQENISNKKCFPIKVRFVQTFMVYLNALSSGIIRFIMSLAILAMTEKSLADVPVYEWDKKTQGFILGAPLWGETVAQFVAGVIINKYGLKISLSVSSIFNGILMMLFPACCSYGGYIGACLLRFLQGVFLSFVFPSIHAFVGKWAPFSERTRIGTFIYTGCFMATVYCMPVSSLILRTSLGWPWLLYIFGIQSTLVGIVWQIYGANSPSEHKTITPEERKFIETSLDKIEETKNEKIPWKNIFTSKPVYAIIICHIGCEWGYTVVHTEMPTYFRKALGIELENAGLLSGLADFVAIFVMIISCILADLLRNKEYFSTTNVRKIFNCIGAWGVSILLLILICLPLNICTSVPIILIVLSVAMDSACTTGFWMNHIDISPNYAEILFGISSNASKVATMSSAIITGYIVNDMSDHNLWKIVFGMCALTYFIGNLIFLLFGSGEVQSWDSSKITIKSDNEKPEILLELKESENNI